MAVHKCFRYGRLNHFIKDCKDLNKKPSVELRQICEKVKRIFLHMQDVMKDENELEENGEEEEVNDDMKKNKFLDKFKLISNTLNLTQHLNYIQQYTLTEDEKEVIIEES